MADFPFGEVQGERMARAVIASVVPPGDMVTSHAFRLRGDGVDVLQLALNDDSIPGLSFAETRHWRRRFDVADPEHVLTGIERGRELGQQILIPGDPHWPDALDPRDFRTPIALWARGNTRLLADPLESRAALVGTDRPSGYGASVAQDLAGWLGADGRTLVTLADPGIARAAVNGALQESNRVIVVQAHSIEQEVFGFEDARARVANGGLLVNARPPGAPPAAPDDFIAARLVAQLAGVTTIVEAPPASKWLNIAFEASEFDRPVGAVPGPVTDPASRGTNDLIRQGAARLVADGSDIADLLDDGRPAASLRLAKGPPARTAAQVSGLTR